MENVPSVNEEQLVQIETYAVNALMQRCTHDLRCIRKTTHLMMMKRQRSRQIRLIKEMIDVRTTHAKHLENEIEWLKVTYKHLLTEEALKTQQLLATAGVSKHGLSNTRCKPGNTLHTKQKE